MNNSRILVVEDEALVAADIEQRLQSLGYEVAGVVDTGEDAVAFAPGSDLDLALMDIRLRGPMSGIEAAGILRLRHQIPVVYLTSHADADTLARAGSTEPFGYIVKPFQEHDLHATIEMAFYRARAEQRVRKMERWLAVTLESIGDGVIATDLAGRVTFMNRMAEKLTGWSSADAIGREMREVFAVCSAMGATTASRLVSRAIEDGRVINLPQGVRLRDRNGREFPVDDSAAPIRDGAGNVIGVVVVFRDRTEHEQLIEQRRRIEQKLLETQKLESLGVLAGGIAHDFNNLLTGIIGNASLAMDMVPGDSEVHEYLSDVRLASQRAADLIKQMLAYSGRGRFVIEPIDLSALVSETAKLITMSVSKKARLQFDLSPDLPPVSADAAQIRQVVMNLVINASEALDEDGGSIDVSTQVTWADRLTLDGAISGFGLAEGRYVVVEVRDTGHGISAENLKRIFDPFFTTKFTGRGLGLAAVIGIVRSHNGALAVESREGEGTVFRMYLPCGDAVAAKAPELRDEPAIIDGSGAILVIDDEPFVRSAAAHILCAHGFEVDQAPDGPQGVELFASRPGRYRVVLLDLTMPSMDGLQVFTAIRHIDPKARIVLMSGYSGFDVTARFDEQGLAGFLQKPFDTAALFAALKTALAEP